MLYAQKTLSNPELPEQERPSAEEVTTVIVHYR
jgi:hypothetical protein